MPITLAFSEILTIIGIVISLFGVVLGYAGSLAGKIQKMQTENEDQKERISALEALKLDVQLARVDERLKSIESMLVCIQKDLKDKKC